MALALGILVAMVSFPVFAAVVNFSDPGLEAAIRDAIGKPTGDIHDADLIELTLLDARGRSIVNLEGIHHCVDLSWLDVKDNQIVDISALAGLTNLTWLYLYDNQIVDISALVYCFE
jgi:internalin A